MVLLWLLLMLGMASFLALRDRGDTQRSTDTKKKGVAVSLQLQPALKLGHIPTALPEKNGGGELRRAYRFTLTEGGVTMDGADDVRGDFRKRRGPLPWQDGMLYCRLLDAQGRVLAEESQAFPNQMCVVLDPNVPDARGNPTPAVFQPPGPAKVQVRLPVLEAAEQLQLYRIAGPRPLRPDQTPGGQLLAHFDLK